MQRIKGFTLLIHKEHIQKLKDKLPTEETKIPRRNGSGYTKARYESHDVTKELHVKIRYPPK